RCDRGHHGDYAFKLDHRTGALERRVLTGLHGLLDVPDGLSRPGGLARVQPGSAGGGVSQCVDPGGQRRRDQRSAHEPSHGSRLARRQGTSEAVDPAMRGERRTRMSERSRTSSPGGFDFVERRWEEDILPALARYIEIPAKSPAFDPQWAEHGHIDRAVALIEDWARRRPIEGLTVETVRLPGRTPLILLEVPGTSVETVLLYGHCDKQPEMVGWSDGLGPWIPVRRG